MPRELLILRHGKSDWATAYDDYHRPLKKRGKRDAVQMGMWLAERRLIPDYVVCSPAERALDTALRVCRAMRLPDNGVHCDRRIYQGSSSDLLKTLADIPRTFKRVLVVGHNPGLEQLVRYLAAPPLPAPEDGKLLPTATLAHLDIPNDWQMLAPGSAKLREIQRPGGMRQKTHGHHSSRF